MTEFELIESIGIFLSNTLSSISVYLTLVSAYLVAAFIAGSRLSRSQVIIVNTLFVTGALIFSYSTIGMLLRQSYFAAKLAEIETDTWLAGTAPVAPVMGALLLAGYLRLPQIYVGYQAPQERMTPSRWERTSRSSIYQSYPDIPLSPTKRYCVYLF